MAIKHKYIAESVFVNGNSSTSGSLSGNGIDITKHIIDVVENSGTEFDSINTDAIVEKTAGHGIDVDGALIKDGGISANSMYAGFYPTGAPSNITAGTGGAIPVTNFSTTINSDAGGDAFTLANGTQIGQLKHVRMVADGGGDCVITPASLSGGTTITMNDAGDDIELLWNGTAWVVIKNVGATVA